MRARRVRSAEDPGRSAVTRPPGAPSRDPGPPAASVPHARYADVDQEHHRLRVGVRRSCASSGWCVVSAGRVWRWCCPSTPSAHSSRPRAATWRSSPASMPARCSEAFEMSNVVRCHPSRARSGSRSSGSPRPSLSSCPRRRAGGRLAGHVRARAVRHGLPPYGVPGVPRSPPRLRRPLRRGRRQDASGLAVRTTRPSHDTDRSDRRSHQRRPQRQAHRERPLSQPEVRTGAARPRRRQAQRLRRSKKGRGRLHDYAQQRFEEGGST